MHDRRYGTRGDRPLFKRLERKTRGEPSYPIEICAAFGLALLFAVLTAGDPRVRRSNRSGLVMFNIHFPRYDKNGEWWSGENTYLSDDKTLADQQWEYLLADDKTSEQIANRNYEAFKLTQKQMEVCHD
jgi:hypothetical protein